MLMCNVQQNMQKMRKKNENKKRNGQLSQNQESQKCLFKSMLILNICQYTNQRKNIIDRMEMKEKIFFPRLSSSYEILRSSSELRMLIEEEIVQFSGLSLADFSISGGEQTDKKMTLFCQSCNPGSFKIVWNRKQLQKPYRLKTFKAVHHHARRRKTKKREILKSIQKINFSQQIPGFSLKNQIKKKHQASASYIYSILQQVREKNQYKQQEAGRIEPIFQKPQQQINLTQLSVSQGLFNSRAIQLLLKSMKQKGDLVFHTLQVNGTQLLLISTKNQMQVFLKYQSFIKIDIFDNLKGENVVDIRSTTKNDPPKEKQALKYKAGVVSGTSFTNNLVIFSYFFTSSLSSQITFRALQFLFHQMSCIPKTIITDCSMVMKQAVQRLNDTCQQKINHVVDFHSIAAKVRLYSQEIFDDLFSAYTASFIADAEEKLRITQLKTLSNGNIKIIQCLQNLKLHKEKCCISFLAPTFIGFPSKTSSYSKIEAELRKQNFIQFEKKKQKYKKVKFVKIIEFFLQIAENLNLRETEFLHQNLFIPQNLSFCHQFLKSMKPFILSLPKSIVTLFLQKVQKTKNLEVCVLKSQQPYGATKYTERDHFIVQENRNFFLHPVIFNSQYLIWRCECNLVYKICIPCEHEILYNLLNNNGSLTLQSLIPFWFSSVL